MTGTAKGAAGLWVRTARRALLIKFGLPVVGVLAAVACGAILIAVITAPAAAPVIAASTVLGTVAEVFGDGGGELTGDELARAGEEAGVRCDAAPAADPPATATTTTTPATDPTTETSTETATPTPEPVAVQPIRIGEGGAISREDAQSLLDPLASGTGTLRAHVWFLYRLAGMGDWDQFATAYENAGLSATEDSPNAPLRQVQLLNATGVGIERYRLTAAAMAAAGEQTGRFTDPYPDYRQLVSVELLSSCLSDAPTGEARMTAPAPAVRTTSAVPPTAAPATPDPTVTVPPGTKIA